MILSPSPFLKFFDNNGIPLVGGKLFTYASGTSTKQATYTDSSGSVQNSNPIILDSRGEATVFLDPTLLYKYVLSPANDTDPPTSPIKTIDPVTSAIDYTQVYYDRTAAEIAAGVTPVNYYKPPGNVFRFGAAGVGGNDTTAIANCIAASPGLEIDFEDGYSFGVSATTNLLDEQRLRGKSRVFATSNAKIAEIFKATSKTGIVIDELEIDGNKANNGADYGFRFVGGSYNYAKNQLYVHDTAQCGGVIEGESGSWILGGRYLNCGQNLTVNGGAATDNHGIMLISTSTTSQAFGAVGARVDSAYRKGITSYTAIGASIKYLVIQRNIVSNCGVTPSSGGGVYLANQPTATDQEGAIVTDNICYGNYVNYEFANVKRISGGNNISLSSVAQGVEVNGVTDGTMPGFLISDSGTIGLNLISCANVAFGVVDIRRSNRSSAGFAPGLNLIDSTYCTFSGGLIYDETPLQTQGIIEQGACDNNDFTNLTVVGSVGALYTLVGANSRMISRSGRNTGFGAITPRNTIDIDGGLTIREQVITLVNGANQNVALPSKAGQLVSNAPTANYSIGGIAGGHNGRRITLINYTSFTMTLNHNDAGSTAGNRIFLSGSANRVVGSLSSLELVWSAVTNSWLALVG